LGKGEENMHKIWSKNHRDSLKKWEVKILAKVLEKVPFDNRNGWGHAVCVNIRCGYCVEFKDGNGCKKCNLYPKYCSNDYTDKNVFRDFMRCYVTDDDIIKKRPAYKRAEKLAHRMIKKIKKDAVNIY
jgi:hypothetical protein